MLGGETCKITFGKLNINSGFGGKRIPVGTVYWEGADFSVVVVVVKFATVSRGGIRPNLS